MWLVRNYEGDFRLFRYKPVKDNKRGTWHIKHCDVGYDVTNAVQNKFNKLTFDTEPIEVTITAITPP